MLEDGYFVCVKKAGLKQTEILTALLADGACFEGDVGKLSCLHGATMPIEIPASPIFMAQDRDGFLITPGGWMPFCPVLYGAEGILPKQRELLTMGGLNKSSSVLSTAEIVASARAAHLITRMAKGKRWTHLSGVKPTSQLSVADVDALFAIFPHVSGDKREEYVIYMINTLHGAASAALGEIRTSTEKKLSLNLMQTVTPHCENVDTEALLAVLVPYYSEHSIGGDSGLVRKGYAENLGDLSASSLSTFGDLGERKPVPDIQFMVHSCASDVFKMFPGGIDGVDNGTKMLELYRALALGVSGDKTTSRGNMEAHKYNMMPLDDPNEISKPGIDLATFICLATLYSARVLGGAQLRECEPRHMHILNMLERMRSLRDEKTRDGECDDDVMKWWLRVLIDDMHAATLFTYMDTGSAIHRMDYDNLAVGKPAERKGILQLALKTYQRPLITMPDASALTRLWVATGGDFIMYAGMVRAMERDVWRSRSDDAVVVGQVADIAQQCTCEIQSLCIHRIVADWYNFTKVDRPGKINVSTSMKRISSASHGIQRRPNLKRTANGMMKEPARMPHDSMFTGTLRCPSASDIVCSPIGNTALNFQESGTPVMYEHEKGKDVSADAPPKKNNRKIISCVINSVMKTVSMGIEKENVELYEQGMGAGAIGTKMTMAGMARDKINILMFGTSPHVAFSDDGTASWNPGTRQPIYTSGIGKGRPRVALQAEVSDVTKGAAEALMGKVTTFMCTVRGEYLDVKKKLPHPITIDSTWRNFLRCGPNLNQYDAMNAPLMAATMVNIFRPVITVQKAEGSLFPQTGFLKSFPYFDRSKLDNVFGNGSKVRYGMDGTFFTPQNNKISLFTHSITTPPTCVPCFWKDALSARLSINTCYIKGMCKGKDVPFRSKYRVDVEPPQTQQSTLNAEQAVGDPSLQQGKHGGGCEVDEDVALASMRRVISAPFVFETDDDDDTAYEFALHEIEAVFPSILKSTTTLWMEGKVLGGIWDILGKNGMAATVVSRVRAVLASYPKWRYVCKVLDVLYSMYAPTEFFIPGKDKGLGMFKYLLAYMTACRVFSAQTFHTKPTYTMCGFVGPCIPKVGRTMNYVLNYDMLAAQDAPYVTTAMDYSLYGGNVGNKIFGGPCMVKAATTQSGILRTMSNEVFANKFTAPYFVMVTPCVPFPDRNKECDRGVAMLSDMSFEEIMSRMESDKMSNIIARACGYDTVHAAAAAEESELVSKLSCLSITPDEATIIARLLQSKVADGVSDFTTDEGIQMTWDDNVELSADEGNQGVDMLVDADDMINSYK